MLYKTVSAAVLTLILVLLVTSTGCTTAYGPNLGLIAYPIPISNYFQDKLEDQFWEKERYATVPILGPITEGGPVTALDPPSDDEIMRALEDARPLEGGLPFLHETGVPRVTRSMYPCWAVLLRWKLQVCSCSLPVAGRALEWTEPRPGIR